MAPVIRDGAGFEAIYVEHFPFVWRCLRALGLPEGAIDDAAQDVFVIVHRQLPAFRGESSVRTWLYSILRNVAANQRRSVRRRGPHAPLSDELESPSAGPHERAQDQQAADFVRTFLASVDEKKRDLFVLAVLEQMSIPEVAEALAIPLNTAYTRLRSVRGDFQAALSKRSAL